MPPTSDPTALSHALAELGLSHPTPDQLAYLCVLTDRGGFRLTPLQALNVTLFFQQVLKPGALPELPDQTPADLLAACRAPLLASPAAASAAPPKRKSTPKEWRGRGGQSVLTQPQQAETGRTTPMFVLNDHATVPSSEAPPPAAWPGIATAPSSTTALTTPTIPEPTPVAHAAEHQTATPLLEQPPLVVPPSPLASDSAVWAEPAPLESAHQTAPSPQISAGLTFGSPISDTLPAHQPMFSPPGINSHSVDSGATLPPPFHQPSPFSEAVTAAATGQPPELFAADAPAATPSMDPTLFHDFPVEEADMLAAAPPAELASLPAPLPEPAPINVFSAASPRDEALSLPIITKDLSTGDIANLLYTYDGEAIVQWAMSALEPKFEWVIHHQGAFNDQDAELVQQLQEVMLLLCAKVYPLPQAVSEPFMKRLEDVEQRLSSSA